MKRTAPKKDLVHLTQSHSAAEPQPNFFKRRGAETQRFRILSFAALLSLRSEDALKKS
jgi:hypothetical protein